MEFKLASYSALVADSEACDPDPHNNGRLDQDHNEPKLAFLQHSAEMVEHPALSSCIGTGIEIACLSVRASTFNPCAHEFVPSVPSKLNAAAKAFDPSPRTKLNSNAPVFVPTPSPPTTVKANAKAPEFMPHH
jgi:hypothetical protein